MSVEYKSYSTPLENLLPSLEEKGVAVVDNVLTAEECCSIRDRIWEQLEYVTKSQFRVSDEATWKFFYSLFPLHSMLLQHFGLGQCAPIWDVRMNPKVGEVFSKIWNCPANNLLVSMDGLSIHLPPEKTGRGWYLGNSWLHTDQSFTKRGRQCIQGVLNLYDVEEGDATFRCYEGSHKFHEEFGTAFNHKEKDDWYRLATEEEREYFRERGCRETAVKAPAGSLILWDSRTMHQGMEAMRARANPKFRMAIYICMMPRAGVAESILAKRRSAFQERRIMTHWANRPKLFPKTPRTYGNAIPDLNEVPFPENAAKSPYGRRLIGW